MEGKLGLNKETLRELTDLELRGVGGGERITTLVTDLTTQTPVCPSGATWFNDCGSIQVTCG